MGLLLRAVDVAGPLRWRWLLTDAETGAPLADHDVDLAPEPDAVARFSDLSRVHAAVRGAGPPGWRRRADRGRGRRLGRTGSARPGSRRRDQGGGAGRAGHGACHRPAAGGSGAALAARTGPRRREAACRRRRHRVRLRHRGRCARRGPGCRGSGRGSCGEFRWRSRSAAHPRRVLPAAADQRPGAAPGALRAVPADPAARRPRAGRGGTARRPVRRDKGAPGRDRRRRRRLGRAAPVGSRHGRRVPA